MNSKLNYTENWPELARQARWSASKLAEKCGVSVRTLERHFNKKVGKSPKLWLTERRQCHAIKLLRDGSSVKEVSILLGYKHSTHFSRKFKNYWGFCPTAKQVLSGLK